MSTFFYSFLPIIIIVMIVGFVVFLTKQNKKKKKAYLSGQKIRLIFGIYLAVLLISVGFFYLIPTDAESTKFGETEPGFPHLSEKIYNGSFAELDEKYVTEQWSFDYEGDELNLETVGNSINGIQLLVDVKSKNDNQIDVTFYQTPTYVEGIDVTDKIKPPLVNLSNKTLTMAKPREFELDFTAFKKVFPMNQFTGEDWGMEDSFMRGEHLLYLQVPKGINIQQGDGLWIEYIRD